MKKYETYKDSGIQWLGEIPSHWHTTKFKRLFSFGRGLSITKADLVDEGVPVISYGQIHSKQNTGTKIENHLLRHIPESYIKGNDSSKVSKGDFIFADTSEDLEGCGNCVYVDVNYQLYAGYHSIIAKNKKYSDAKYLAYLFKTDYWRSQIRSSVNGVKVFSITQNTLSDTDVLVPSIKEQQAIASYLDCKVGQIDAAIEEKVQILEDLKAYRSAIISEAVTGGLDKNVEMKDSGIEWMGMIPDSWKIMKTSFLFEEIGSGTTPNTNTESFYVEEGVNWLQTGDLNDFYIDRTSKHISDEAFNSHSALHLYPVGSLVIAMYGATIGKLGILNIESATNQACCVLSKPKYYNTKYAYYSFLASKDSLITNALGGGQPNISQSIIRNHKLPVPSIKEQEKIVEFLDSKVEIINQSIDEIQFQIDNLKAYKSSIITEAVTGKVDLRDWKPKQVNT